MTELDNLSADERRELEELNRRLRWGREREHAAFMARFAEHREKMLDVLRSADRSGASFDEGEAWRQLEDIAEQIGAPDHAVELLGDRSKLATKLAKALRDASELLGAAIQPGQNGFIPNIGAALIEARCNAGLLNLVHELEATAAAADEVAEVKVTQGRPGNKVRDPLLQRAITLLAQVYYSATARKPHGVANDAIERGKYIPEGSFPKLVRTFLAAADRPHSVSQIRKLLDA